jgi:monofunctional chorismate mutase
VTAPVVLEAEMTTHEQRHLIDQIDRGIAELLKQRASISHEIQKSRVRSGGARTDLGREREVITAYVGHLGPRGSDVANTVLTYCRGEIDDATRNERQGQAVHADGVAG